MRGEAIEEICATVISTPFEGLPTQRVNDKGEKKIETMKCYLCSVKCPFRESGRLDLTLCVDCLSESHLGSAHRTKYVRIDDCIE